MAQVTKVRTRALNSPDPFRTDLRGPRLGGTHTDARSEYTEQPARVQERQRRHTLELLAVCAIGLVPWTVLLALTLPAERQVHEWRVTWVGFDVLLVVAMASTAFFGRRRRRAVVVSALATAVLLVCDAWFDVSLDFGTPDIWMSGALALFVELPLAAFLIHRVHSLIPSTPWTAYGQGGQEPPRSGAEGLPVPMAPGARQSELRDKPLGVS
jgi:hypothetical protein